MESLWSAPFETWKPGNGGKKTEEENEIRQVWFTRMPLIQRSALLDRLLWEEQKSGSTQWKVWGKSPSLLIFF